LKKIFVVVRNAVGVDYSEYKTATLERRLSRRMALRNISSRENYLKLLLEEPDEARVLYEDVLIHVTSFFRDAEVFEEIKQSIFPRIGRRVIRISACVVHSRADVPMILLALEDITARQQAEDERAELLKRARAAQDEAERANTAKDLFLATLSHELRTPLATLLMQSQLLRRGTVDAAKIQRIGATIERSTRLQLQLIDDLLDVSRIVAGKLTIARQEADLASIAYAALENVSALVLTKAVRFSTEIEPIATVFTVDSQAKHAPEQFIPRARRRAPPSVL